MSRSRAPARVSYRAPTRRVWAALTAMAMTFACAEASSAQTLLPGRVLESVPTLADATQSYALYLPSTYTTNRKWPVLMGFHPAARGRAIVDTYRDAAERYGFIVAGSNNSRNGPWEPSLQAAITTLQDLGQRFAADGNRIYLTGHSGGARVALQIALANKQIAGVIASSAGYPDVQPRSSVPFAIFGTAGVDDFNYIEMRMLSRALRTPHRVVIFDGGHILPPPDVAMQAIEWLELQAMVSGRRARDEALIDRFWTAQEHAANDAGDTAPAVQLLRAMADDFRTLRDVKTLDARASELAKRKDIRQALDRERDLDDNEVRTLDEFTRYQAGLADDTRRLQSLQGLNTLLIGLNTRATAAEDSPQRAQARRLLRAVTLGAEQRVQDADFLKLLQRYRLPAPASGAR